MLIRVDEASDRPIYSQIADSVRADMLAGRIVPGTVLPPAREVGAGLGVNVHTVLKAYQLLRDEGLVDLKRRRGAVVTEAAGAVSVLGDDIERLITRAAAVGVGHEALASMIMARAVPADVVDSGAPQTSQADAAAPTVGADEHAPANTSTSTQ